MHESTTHGQMALRSHLRMHPGHQPCCVLNKQASGPGERKCRPAPVVKSSRNARWRSQYAVQHRNQECWTLEDRFAKQERPIGRCHVFGADAVHPVTVSWVCSRDLPTSHTGATSPHHSHARVQCPAIQIATSVMIVKAARKSAVSKRRSQDHDVQSRPHFALRSMTCAGRALPHYATKRRRVPCICRSTTVAV